MSEEFIQPLPRKNVKRENENNSKRKSENDVLDKQLLKQVLQEAEEDESLNFDREIMQKLFHEMENNLIKNLELRRLHPNEPKLFLESEELLDQNIKKLMAICAYPEYWEEFSKSKCIKTLIQLIEHPNTDISIDTITFFQELIPQEIDEELESQLKQIIQILVNENFIEAIFMNIHRADEKIKEEYEMVYQSLAIVDNIIQIDQNQVKEIYERSKFYDYALDRISKKDIRIIDDIKFYCSELILYFIQESKYQQDFLILGGIDSYLEIISKYNTEDPKCEEEKEFVLNLFNALQILLVKKEFSQKFQQLLGIELMIAIIKSKRFISRNALSLISFSILDNKEIGEYFIDQGGLTIIFPILMKKGIKGKNKNEQQGIDNDILLIIKLLVKDSSIVFKERAVNKFRESDYEKIDRLFELHSFYWKIYQEQQNGNEDVDEDDDLNTIHDTSLSILESLDFIILFLNIWKDQDISNKVAKNIKKFPEFLQQSVHILNNLLKQIDSSQKEDILLYNKLINGLDKTQK